MPASQIGLSVVLNWQLVGPIAGFNSKSQGDSEGFGLAGIDLSTYNQVFAEKLDLSENGMVTVDLTQLYNHVDEAFGFKRVITLMVAVSGNPGGKVLVRPSTHNPATWFFADPVHPTNPTAADISSGIYVKAGAAFVYSEDPVEGGYTINSTHKNIDIWNVGGVETHSPTSPVEVLVVVVGGTS